MKVELRTHPCKVEASDRGFRPEVRGWRKEEEVGGVEAVGEVEEAVVAGYGRL